MLMEDFLVGEAGGVVLFVRPKVEWVGERNMTVFRSGGYGGGEGY
jgi:hypothetical protein